MAADCSGEVCRQRTGSFMIVELALGRGCQDYNNFEIHSSDVMKPLTPLSTVHEAVHALCYIDLAYASQKPAALPKASP